MKALRILGGVLKGFPLPPIKEDIVRPTAVMLRRKVFDSHQNFEGITFYDLFAGSGAMGLEAWSRGAKAVYLVENNPRVMKNLKIILEKIQNSFQEQLEQRPIIIVNQSAQRFIIGKASFFKGEELVYLDPPYEHKNLYTQSLNSLAQSKYRGKLWLESCENKGESLKYWEEYASSLGCSVSKHYSAGSKYISVYDFGL